jgi:hypothetical protein
MRVVSIALAFGVVLLASQSASAQATFRVGHYTNPSAKSAMDVNTPTHVRTDIDLFPECYGALIFTFNYSIPPNYKNTMIHGDTATCSGTANCPDFDAHCGTNNVPLDAAFSQPNNATVVYRVTHGSMSFTYAPPFVGAASGKIERKTMSAFQRALKRQYVVVRH